MKTAVLFQTGKMTVTQTEKPVPGSEEVLLKVMACGVCGTDIHIFEGHKGAADNPLPIVLGHEFSGIIEGLGEGVSGFSIGDRVCADPNVMCGHCRFCQAGIGHFCENMTGIGTTVNGGFAQYCAVPASQLHKLADYVSFAQGAMAEPLACCIHGIDMCRVQPGSDVAVIGGGMIGMLMLQLALLGGAARVAMIEPVAEKRKMAKTLGSCVCVDPMTQDVPAALKSAGIDNISAVIECVGKPQTIEQAVAIAGKGAVVMMFGLTAPEESMRLLPYEVFKKELTVTASYINPYTTGRATALINVGRIDVSAMVAEKIPLEKLPALLADSVQRSRGKYIVEPWQE